MLSPGANSTADLSAVHWWIHSTLHRSVASERVMRRVQLHHQHPSDLAEYDQTTWHATLHHHLLRAAAPPAKLLQPRACCQPFVYACEACPLARKVPVGAKSDVNTAADRVVGGSWLGTADGLQPTAFEARYCTNTSQQRIAQTADRTPGFCLLSCRCNRLATVIVRSNITPRVCTTKVKHVHRSTKVNIRTSKHRHKHALTLHILEHSCPVSCITYARQLESESKSMCCATAHHGVSGLKTSVQRVV